MTIVAGGKTQIAVNTAAVGQGDSVAAYLADAAGTFLTSTLLAGKQRLDVIGPSDYAEDSAHVSGDYGSFVMGVRNDAGTALAADGDYIPFSMTSTGALRVEASLTAAFDFVYPEDSAHVSGDSGAFVLAVRNDANATLTSADGDYSAIAVDLAGRVKTVSAGTFAEDTAHTTGDIGSFSLTVRSDAAGSSAGTTGDYATFSSNEQGELRVINKAETAILQQIVTVGTTATLLPATALASRKSLMIQMLSGGQLYIGDATVTNAGATRGPLLGQGGIMTLDIGPTVDVYGIANAAGKEVAVLEMS